MMVDLRCHFPSHLHADFRFRDPWNHGSFFGLYVLYIFVSFDSLPPQRNSLNGFTVYRLLNKAGNMMGYQAVSSRKSGIPASKPRLPTGT